MKQQKRMMKRMRKRKRAMRMKNKAIEELEVVKVMKKEDFLGGG